jgi:hypothetical protein
MPGHPKGVNRASFLRIGSTATKASFIGISTGSGKTLSQNLTRKRRT